MWEYRRHASPPYTEQQAAAAKSNPQSHYIKTSTMCAHQQSWRWEWRSQDPECPFEQPNRSSLCHRLRDKRILLYGDSLTQQLFVSLASLAGDAHTAGKPGECSRVKPVECVRVCDGTSLLCQRLRFGLVLDTLGERHAPLGNCSVRPTGVGPLSEIFSPPCICSFDLMIIQEFAHWVGANGAMFLEKCLRQQGYPNAGTVSQSHVLQLYGEQMRRNAAFLRNATSGQRTRVVFRTAIPGYPPKEILAPHTPDGKDPVFVAPSTDTSWAARYSEYESSKWNHHMWAKINEAAKSAYAANGLSILDTEPPMLQRVDGHLDELHYCLPGPPDFYSYAIFNYLL